MEQKGVGLGIEIESDINRIRNTIRYKLKKIEKVKGRKSER